MSWYRTGTITLASGSRTVLGVGTEWVANVLPAAMLLQDGPPLEVERVIADGELLLKVAYVGAGGAGLTYAIAPTQGHVTEATRLLLQVLETFGDLRQAWLDGSLKGDPGTGLAIRGAVATVGDLPASPRLGDAYLIGEDIHVWVGSSWFNAGPLRGATGPANVLSIGTVETGEAGTPASASVTGEAPAQQLNLVLPRGATGGITPELQALHDDALVARDESQAARNTASGHANAAAASAGTASGAAGVAQGHASAASGSATDAASQKAAAQTAAGQAADSAATASGHANDADASAAAAAASEGAALGHAEAAADSASDAAASAAVAGIIGITVNGAGHLIITRADSTTFDAGYVIGPGGPVGASIKVKPSVDTVGDLPPAGNEENDARVVRADGHLYVWDGSAWTDGGQFQGPPGTTNYLDLLNRPTLGTAAALDVPASGAATSGQAVRGDDPRLSDARNPTAHTHAASQISDSTPTGRALMTAADAAAGRAALGAGTSSFSGAWADLGGKPAAIAAGATPAAALAAIGAAPIESPIFTGPVGFPNGAWNALGDDVLFGDFNVAGAFCLRPTNAPHARLMFFDLAGVPRSELAATDVGFSTPQQIHATGGLMSSGRWVAQLGDDGKVLPAQLPPIAAHATGDLLLTARALAPPDWLAMNTAYAQIDYPALFALLGTRSDREPGVSWDAISAISSVSLSAVASNDDVVISVGAGGVLRRSVDKGITWPTVSGVTGTINGVAHLYGTTFMACSSDGSWRSTDNGASWTRIVTTASQSAAGLSETNIVVVGESGFLRYSTNGGASLAVPTGHSGTAHYYCAARVSATVGLAAGSALYRSTNSGAAWSLVTTANGAPATYIRALKTIATNLVLAVGDGGVHRSTNGGSTWAAISGTTGVLTCIERLSDTVALVAGAAGMWITRDAGLTFEAVPAVVATNIKGIARVSDTVIVAVGQGTTGAGANGSNNLRSAAYSYDPATQFITPVAPAAPAGLAWGIKS